MYKNYFKRAFDLLFISLVLLIIWPFLLIVIICLHFANKGAGVFFLQERPGKNGNIFKIMKFKSMTDEKDANGELLPNEKRITPIGRFIRKTSIDELPQFFNILKGDMSLIGPRPLPVRYLSLYNEVQAHRHDVRPGITGWAQVHGRNSITWTHKFELDVWYVNHISFWVDMKIVFLTIKKVIFKEDIDSSSQNVGGTSFNGSN